MLDIFYEGKIEKTGQLYERSESTKVSLQISQELKNHKPQGDFNFLSILKFLYFPFVQEIMTLPLY
jgi:hypothetical protein